jgi:hypothetical protein
MRSYLNRFPIGLGRSPPKGDKRWVSTKPPIIAIVLHTEHQNEEKEKEVTQADLILFRFYFRKEFTRAGFD